MHQESIHYANTYVTQLKSTFNLALIPLLGLERAAEDYKNFSNPFRGSVEGF